MEHDTIFQMSAANIRFGPGATAEVGMDLRDMQARRTLLIIDPRLRSLPTGDVGHLVRKNLDLVILPIARQAG